MSFVKEWDGKIEWGFPCTEPCPVLKTKTEEICIDFLREEIYAYKLKGRKIRLSVVVE